MDDKKIDKKPNYIEIFLVSMAFQLYIYSFYLIPGMILMAPIFGALFAAYFYKRQGPAFTFILQAVIVGILFNLPISLVVVFGVAPIIIGTMTRVKLRFELIVMITSITILSGIIALVYYINLSTDIKFNDILTDATNQYIASIEQSTLFTPKTSEMLKENINLYTQLIRELWFAMLVITAIVIAVIQSYLTRVFINGLKWGKENLKSVFYYSLPKSAMMFFAICYIVMELSTNEMLTFITYTLVAVVLFIITCNGITYCIYTVIKTKQLSAKIVLGLLTPAVVVLFPIVMTLVGGVDSVFHKRRQSEV